MKREIITTADGSHTVQIQEWNVTYHSHHGAIQESLHVFIEAGLRYWCNRQEPGSVIRIFEMGFGTGLNAFLTAIEAEKRNMPVHYTTVEKYPLAAAEARNLNYAHLVQQESLFAQLHQSIWDEAVCINSNFTLHKLHTDLASYAHKSEASGERFNIIYYDAFAPAAQPELWSKELFEDLYRLLLPGGVLTTYCSKGDVRRALQAAGFAVTKLAGPPGKREMVRAEK